MHTTPTQRAPVAALRVLPQLVVHDGTLEGLKWFALSLMTADHVNKYLFKHMLPGVYELGRIVLPLFGFILAYNLARPNAHGGGVHARVLRRLALFGTIASPIFFVINGWWPLNVLWLLFLATAVVYCIERRQRRFTALAVLLFVVAGAFVEYWWFGLLFCLAAWWYCKESTWTALGCWLLSAVSLSVVNQNPWALAALPVIFLAPHFHLQIPRLRWAFYAYYPAHLAVLMILSGHD